MNVIINYYDIIIFTILFFAIYIMLYIFALINGIVSNLTVRGIILD